MSVSIKDIAKAAGVSHSTVSRALRQSGLVNAETAARIRGLAQEMGYTPSAVAQSLVTRRTRTLGLVVTTISDPFVDRIVEGVEQAAAAAGYGVFLSSSQGDPERELAVVDLFHRQRVDGVIVLASRVGRLYGERLRELSVPIVLINNEAEGSDLHAISVDQQQGARLAVRHLVDLGHRRIGYIGSASRPIGSQLRQRGYQVELAAQGLDAVGDWVVLPDMEQDIDGGRQGFAALWQRGCSAIFCYNDRTAIGVLLAAREAGINVPEQLSVVGFDDIEAATYVTPPLTTLQQPRFEMGQLSVGMLLDLVESKPVANRVLPCRLMVRSSTGPSPASAG